MTLIKNISSTTWRQRFIAATIVASALYIGYRWSIRKDDDDRTPRPSRRRIRRADPRGLGGGRARVPLGDPDGTRRMRVASKRALALPSKFERINQAIAEGIRQEFTSESLRVALPASATPALLSETGIDLEAIARSGRAIAAESGRFTWEEVKANFETLFTEIDRARNEEGCSIYMHNITGRGVGATILIAYMIRTFEVSYEEAFAYVQARIPSFALEGSLEKGLRGYEIELKQKRERASLFED